VLRTFSDMKYLHETSCSNTYIRMCIWIHIDWSYTYIYACIYICLLILTRQFESSVGATIIPINKYIYGHSNMYTYTRICTYTNICLYVYGNTYKYIHINTYICCYRHLIKVRKNNLFYFLGILPLYICDRTYINMDIYVHIYLFICIYIYYFQGILSRYIYDHSYIYIYRYYYIDFVTHCHVAIL
jgi:hypothetical protein